MKLPSKFSQLEKMAVNEFINLWLEDEQGFHFLDLNYVESKYARYEYNWEENEGFKINDQEYFDHLTVNVEGKAVIVTINNDKEYHFYTVDI